MSEPELTPITPKTTAIPQPSQAKTSAVPLKKETVRITLRARPGAGVTQPRESTAPVSLAPGTSSVPLPAPSAPKRATAQISLPSGPLPPPSAKAATSPVQLPPAPIPPPGRKTMAVPAVAPAPTPPAPAPAPSAPAPSAPPAPGVPRPAAPGAPRPAAPGAPRPAAPGAPSAPRPAAPGAPAAPRMETGAATQPLSAAPRPPMAGGPRPAAPAGQATAPMGAGGAATANLPKATQKLQAATQPMARPTVSAPPSAPVKRAQVAADSEQFYEDKDPEAGLVPLSIVCLLLSVMLMLVQMLATDRVFKAVEGEESGIKIPEAANPSWETFDEVTGTYRNTYKSTLPDIP